VNESCDARFVTPPATFKQDHAFPSIAGRLGGPRATRGRLRHQPLRGPVRFYRMRDIGWSVSQQAFLHVAMTAEGGPRPAAVAGAGAELSKPGRLPPWDEMKDILK